VSIQQLNTSCSMLRIKEEAHHLKQTMKVLLQVRVRLDAVRVTLTRDMQTLIDVDSGFEELGPSISEAAPTSTRRICNLADAPQLLEDSHTFDAGSCQIVIKGGSAA
jgi:hypothetical protein